MYHLLCTDNDKYIPVYSNTRRSLAEIQTDAQSLLTTLNTAKDHRSCAKDRGYWGCWSASFGLDYRGWGLDWVWALCLGVFVHLSGLASAINGNLARALVSAAPAFRIYQLAFISANDIHIGRLTTVRFVDFQALALIKCSLRFLLWLQAIETAVCLRMINIVKHLKDWLGCVNQYLNSLGK